jgi:competence protein ComEA
MRNKRQSMRRVLKIGWAACGIFYLSSVVIASAQSVPPDGHAKAVFERICSNCHGVEEITRKRLTEEQWTDVIDSMISRGAEGTDEEMSQVLQYLVKNFPKESGAKTGASKINVNKASAKELAGTIGISMADAEAIVAYREKNGNFKELQDLKKVPGIDVRKVEDNQGRLEF